ncbi:MAG: hypothetical protein EKK49_02050 [Rhodocyclaceae bacterium]|nr:MAG: hypothetical protein EKK49_02050 [Rhodocyclaceae bacterium]
MHERNNFISAWGLVASALIISASLLSAFATPLGVYDEGFAITNAERIINGETPHLDYWTAYPPGTSLTLSLFFVLFEPSLVVARVVNLLWSCLLIGSVFYFVRAFSGRLGAAFAATLSSLWLGSALYPSYSATPALALIFLSIALAAQETKRGGTGLIPLAGVVAGFVAIFRHDFAAYFFASALGSFLVSIGLRGSIKISGRYLNSVVSFLLVFFGVSLFLLVTVAARGGVENFIEQEIVFPVTGMRENRLLPVPGFLELFLMWDLKWVLRWVLAWGGIVFPLAGLALTTKSHIKAFPGYFIAEIFCALMTMIFTVQSHNRFDLAHTAPSMLFLLCFASIVSAQKSDAAGYVRRSLQIFILMAATLMSIYAAPSYGKLNDFSKCTLGRSLGDCIPIHQDQIGAVNYINKKYPEVDYVFVGNTHHDMILFNDSSMYFLLSKHVPVAWSEMHPGIVTTRQVQEKMIDQLIAHNVSVVILVDVDNSLEKNSSAISSGVFVLDEFISRNFSAVYKVGRYSVLERKKDYLTRN